MKIAYDFHIHSALSPCADDSMTPCGIAAAASLKGLRAIAVTDHNAIGNVRATAEVAEAMGIIVLYGIEVQTAEDIHVLALFPEYRALESFFNTLRFPDIKNNPDIFGRQLLFDADDNIVGEEERCLCSSCDEGIYAICGRIVQMGGKAIPAHIDREANGILAILGDIPKDLTISALEFSPYADKALVGRFSEYKRIIDSDSHIPETIMTEENLLEVRELTAKAVFDAI
jgi:hypothetical protein